MARPVSKAPAPPSTTLTRKKTASDWSSDRNSGIEKCIVVPSVVLEISVPAAFKVGRLDFWPIEQLPAAAAERDRPVDHDVAAVCQPQGVKGILLDEEDCQFVVGVE